ncbi:MAG: rhodanese-like domain-containing protein [Gammaproteobacteria bacterium]|jgi:rhodanese-related sulfurtransferase|nr:rhodanese-like domain-containing protein [Gammaproteobacteria bacterium]
MSLTQLGSHRTVAVVAATLLLAGCLPTTGPTLTASEAFERTNSGEVTLIDIRTPIEWRQTGVAEGAHRIDMRHPKGPEGFADQVLAEVGGDKDAPVALICRTGNRSGHMQRALIDRGFTNVYNVLGGMAGSRAGAGWIRASLPVEPCPRC